MAEPTQRRSRAPKGVKKGAKKGVETGAKKAGPKAPPASGKAAPPPPANGGTDWAALADRAARRVKELADRARPQAEKAAESARKVAVDVSGDVEKAFEKVRAQAKDLLAKGQHTRVRIKFRGKQLAELPIAAVAAAEVASFAWFGPLRLLVGHLMGKAVLDVEFVSNADGHVADGRAALADGELEKAVLEFDRALAMDRRHAGALLGKAIALKLKGDRTRARELFEQAESADPRGEAGREARRHLDNL